MVLTVSFELSPVTGLVCHRRPRTDVVPKPGRADITSANLTQASGRQDHTTSPYAATSFVSAPFDRSRILGQTRPASRFTPDAAAPTASHPASVTIAIRPCSGTGWREVVEMICPTGEAKYFCKGDSTGKLQRRPTGKSPVDTARERGPRAAKSSMRRRWNIERRNCYKGFGSFGLTKPPTTPVGVMRPVTPHSRQGCRQNLAVARRSDVRRETGKE
jgi:hypothetical protein